MPGADVLILKSRVINRDDIRKTKHSMLAIRYKGILVGIDSRMPNHVFVLISVQGYKIETNSINIIERIPVKLRGRTAH